MFRETWVEAFAERDVVTSGCVQSFDAKGV